MSVNLSAEIAACIAEKKPVMLGSLAQRFEVTELEIAKALPEGMACFAPAESLEAVWEELTHWEKATFIMQHLGTVLEVKCQIPQGKFGHGYFNLMGDCLGGHLKMDDLECIAFMNMPFMGLTSLSLQFFNKDGAVKFSIYAGRENKVIIASVQESFEAMKSKYSV